MALMNDTLVGQSRPARARLIPERLSQARLSQIVTALAARPGGWGDVVRFEAGRRWYQRLELAADRAVWLLAWLPGQGRGLHDHGHAAGAFAVAQGQVRERPVAAWHGQPVRNLTVARGSVRAFGPHYAHDVVNVFAGPAIT